MTAFRAAIEREKMSETKTPAELLELERDKNALLRRELENANAKNDVLVLVLRDTLEAYQRKQLAQLAELRVQNGLRS
jgi:hypothetical protein